MLTSLVREARQAPSPAAPSLDASLASNGALADALRAARDSNPDGLVHGAARVCERRVSAARGKPPVLARAHRARRARAWSSRRRRAGATSCAAHARALRRAAARLQRAGGEGWGQPAYRQLTRGKFAVFRYVVEAGYTTLLSDVDVAFRADPTPELRRLLADGVDMVNMVDDRVLDKSDGAACPAKPKDPNSGFFLVRPSEGSLAVMRRAAALLAAGTAGYDGYDQGALTQALGEHASRTARWPGSGASVRHAYFNCSAVANGYNFFVRPAVARGAAVVHANWMSGSDSKERCLRAADLWALGDDGKRCAATPQAAAAAAPLRPPLLRAELDKAGMRILDCTRASAAPRGAITFLAANATARPPGASPRRGGRRRGRRAHGRAAEAAAVGLEGANTGAAPAAERGRQWRGPAGATISAAVPPRRSAETAAAEAAVAEAAREVNASEARAWRWRRRRRRAWKPRGMRSGAR